MTTESIQAQAHKPNSTVSHRRAWLLALRPKTLPAAVVPIVVGAACAHHAGQVHGKTTAVALLCALCLQVGSNFANDVFDYENGADAADRVGPARAVAQGWISPGAMKRAMWGVLALAFLLGLYLTSVGGWVFLALGLSALISAVAYTGGPYPLGYNGLGDVFVFLFFGPVAVCGTTLLNAGTITPLAWLCAVPVGALTTAILVVNNVRDFETDARAGKRTLVVRLGRTAGVAEYAGLFLLAYAVPLVLWLQGQASSWVLLPWLSAPLAWRRLMDVVRLRGHSLNPTLAGTAALLVLFGLMLSAGLMVENTP